MNKYTKYASIIFASMALIYSGVAYAETNSKPLKAKTEMKDEVKEAKASIFETVRENKIEFRKDMNTKMTEMKAKIATQKEELKKNLAKIKDEKKRATVEGVNSKIQDLNTKATDEFSGTVARIETILVNIESRINASGLNSAEVSAVTANNEKALKTIIDTKSAIVAQAGKVYTINITGEKTLRSDVQKTRDELNKDLKALNDKVKMARDAVKVSSDMIAKIPGINSDYHSNQQVEGGATKSTNY